MKKFLILFSLMSILFISNNRTYAQLLDEKNVTITMDLQPILQLNMTTSDHVDFVFNDIKSYYSGVIKYGATILKVSSSVTWDLYAVGFSNGLTANWDYQEPYGQNGVAGNPNAINAIPIHALELHQTGPNNHHNAIVGTRYDYSNAFINYTAFVAGNTGLNSIYCAGAGNSPYTPPAATDKYINGHKGTAVAVTAQGVPAGSYLTVASLNTNPAAGSIISDYYFVIDYRILPGLPAVFPFAGTQPAVSEALNSVLATNFAQPGVYTMGVKYVILEDQ